MRVVAGFAKGRLLKSPDGTDIVRPTTDKVKESLFSSIQFETQGCVFLDLFAGSGQMGIEAISRGAKRAYFVDNNRHSLSVINENIRLVRFEDRASVIFGDYHSILTHCTEKVDIAFLDPPYSKKLLSDAMQAILPIMGENSKIICESPIDEELMQNVGCFVKLKERTYGKIKLTTYSNAE